jgi:hypothetical protein
MKIRGDIAIEYIEIAAVGNWWNSFCPAVGALEVAVPPFAPVLDLVFDDTGACV